MRPLISILTLFALGLHTLLGCCVYHSHARMEGLSATCNRGEQQVADHSHAACFHHHHHVAHSTPTGSSPAPDDEPNGDCHETHCFFTISGTTTVETQLLATAALVDALLPTNAIPDLVAAPIGTGDSGPPLLRLGDSLRVRSQLQVWLI